MSRAPRVAVVGAGSWGTTVASLTAANAPTTLWARDPRLAEAIRSSHTNERYQPDAELAPELDATDSLEQAAAVADVLVLAGPSHGFTAVLEQAAPHVRPWIPVVSLTKGLEERTRLRMTQVVDELLPGHPVGVLSGPNVAKEVMDGLAAAAVVAIPDEQVHRPSRRSSRRGSSASIRAPTEHRRHGRRDCRGPQERGRDRRRHGARAGPWR
jgi:glycerol-3-phosphate dehydrogenase (NAD(P)+)